jgi:hypothetical protein
MGRRVLKTEVSTYLYALARKVEEYIRSNSEQVHQEMLECGLLTTGDSVDQLAEYFWHRS